LEEITTLLEDESVDLDEALKAFEKGNELIVVLKKQLEAAEIRVKEINKSTTNSKNK
jgi:exodeoxyribonuclease VII small subunit